MPYSVPDILNWASISQPFARYGESQRVARGDGAADPDLDMKLYNTRMDCLYEFEQDPDSDNLYAMGNYLLTLCGRYLFQATAVMGETGEIASISGGGGATITYIGLEMP